MTRPMCGTFNAYTHPRLAVRYAHNTESCLDIIRCPPARLLMAACIARLRCGEQRKGNDFGPFWSVGAVSILPVWPSTTSKGCQSLWQSTVRCASQCVRPRRTINKTRYAGPPLSYQLTAPASSAPEAALVGGLEQRDAGDGGGGSLCVVSEDHRWLPGGRGEQHDRGVA